jgi:hypothetical protein
MEVDYGDLESLSGVQFKTSVSMSGINMMIINDRKNVFYPILQMSIEKFDLRLENKIETINGSTDLKIVISYYNNSLDVWEPFLESTNLALSFTQDQFVTHMYACFKTPVNLNFSEELIENVLHAYNSFEKTKKSEATNQQ